MKGLTLEGDYTNHSIRATVISTLDEAGFEGRHIIQLSPHKSEATIKDNSRKCPESKRKEMFQSLSDRWNTEVNAKSLTNQPLKQVSQMFVR